MINVNLNIVVICASNHIMQIIMSFWYTELCQTLCQPVTAEAELYLCTAREEKETSTFRKHQLKFH